jgi:predicted naringenin-chalcone synthase
MTGVVPAWARFTMIIESAMSSANVSIVVIARLGCYAGQDARAISFVKRNPDRKCAAISSVERPFRSDPKFPIR